MVTGGFEAAGDAITGAVIGRAIEPVHGEGARAAPGVCLNCGTEIRGAHCHACGQKAHIHRTLHEYGHDLLHGVFHFEGKVWRTLPMLAFKPGELTRRYIHGERAKFVSPMALFLFAVFLMFAVVGGLAGEMHAPEAGLVQANLKGKPLGELDKELQAARAKKAAIDAQIKQVQNQNGDTTALEKQNASISNDLEALSTARSMLTGDKLRFLEGGKLGWSRLDAAVKKANANPNLFLYKLQSSAYKYSWALIPLSVPFVWMLFFWKRQYKLYDHAIFVTYSLTFMLFLIVVLTVISYTNMAGPLVPIAATFVPPIHIYKQLRGAYGVSRAGGLLRTFALAVFGSIVLMLFLLLLVMLGVLG